MSGNRNAKRTCLEVAISRVADGVLAMEAGADRLELASALEIGGLTPSVGAIRQLRAAVTIPIVVLIRPRPAGFRYDEAEQRVMLDDVRQAVDAGADFVAVGSLTAENRIDRDFLAKAIDIATADRIVVHRAFDLVEDQIAELGDLIDMGIARVLTSGGEPSAWLGRERLAELQTFASGNVEILPASGIVPDNALKLLQITGCDQVHGTFRRNLEDPAGPIDTGSYPAVDEKRVAAMRRILDDHDRRRG